MNNNRDIFIEMNKGDMSGESINMYCDKHKYMFNKIDHVYHFVGSLNITDELISKTKDHVYYTMLLWGE